MSEISASTRKNRSDFIAEQLEEAVINGAFPAGSRLDEASIALQFGVSRTPVREALHILCGRGWAEREPFKGVVVTQISAERIDEMFEAMAELEDLLRYATRYLHRVRPSDLRFVLVEASDRILPEVGEEMGRWTVEALRERGIEVRLGTRLESTVGGVVQLSDGTTMLSDTVVWTAGVKAHPMLEATDLPLDDRGRLTCRADLSVVGTPDAWGAGDCAAIPDLTRPGETCPPSRSEERRVGKECEVPCSSRWSPDH